jgi:predicted O-methyltransferase YrrM
MADSNNLFTYQHIRDTVKTQISQKPFSCTYHWVINWINTEISKLPPGSIILELGTFVGGSTHLIAKANRHVIIHTIDLNKFDENSHMLEAMKKEYSLPKLKPSDLLEIQKMHVEDFENIILHTGDSKSLDINNISLVFIDAGHTEEEVQADLEYAWDRVIPGGFIFGDDANYSNVYNAFAKFARDKDIELTLYSKCVRIKKTNKINPDQRFFDMKLTEDILIAKH